MATDGLLILLRVIDTSSGVPGCECVGVVGTVGNRLIDDTVTFRDLANFDTTDVLFFDDLDTFGDDAFLNISVESGDVGVGVEVIVVAVVIVVTAVAVVDS